MARSKLPDESATSIAPMQPENHVASPFGPVIRKKPSKGRTNLRKSLAWNEAFFTDEGVLDVDELQIVAKTPKKPLQLPLIDIPELPRAPPVAGGAAPFPGAGSGAGQNAQLGHENQKLTLGALEESEGHNDIYDLEQDDQDPDESLLDGDINSVCKQISTFCIHSAGLLPQEGFKDVVQPPSDQGYLYVSQPASSTKSVPAALNEFPDPLELVMQHPVQSVIGTIPTGTRLRLPGSFAKDIHVERDAEDLSKLPPLPSKGKLQRSQSAMVLPTASTSLSKKVSSMSKRVKEVLGKVIPGRSTNSKKLKEAADKSSGKQPSSATLPTRPLEASPRLTSAHASSPFNRSGRNILPETKQKALNAVPSGPEKSSKLTATHTSSPFNRSGRNILPEASAMSTRHQSRNNGCAGASEVSAKLSSGYASSPFNRSGRNILPEAVLTRQQTSLVTNGHGEVLAKLSSGAASSPFNRSGRNILTDASGMANQQQPSVRTLEASVKPTSKQASSLLSHSGRNILPEISKVSSGQQVRGTSRASNLANENTAKLNSGHSSSPLNRSGRNMLSEGPTLLSRSKSVSNSTSAGGAKLTSHDLPVTKFGTSKGSAPAPAAPASAISKTKVSPQVISKVKSDASRPPGTAGVQNKAGDSSKQILPNKSGTGTSVVQKQDIMASTTVSKTKPSGLRLPAPKLGFFESVRTNGPSTSLNNTAKRILPPRVPDPNGRSRLPSVPPGRAGTDLSAAAVHARVQSNIPAAPHLRGSDGSSRYRAFSVSAPSSPHRSTSRTFALGVEQRGQSGTSCPSSELGLSNDSVNPAVLDVFAQDDSSLPEDISEREIHQRLDSSLHPSPGNALPFVSRDEVRQGDWAHARATDVCILGPGAPSNRHRKDSMPSSMSPATSPPSLGYGMQRNGGSMPDRGSPEEALYRASGDPQMSLAELAYTVEARLATAGEANEPSEAVPDLTGSNHNFHLVPEVIVSVVSPESSGQGHSACQPGHDRDNGSWEGGAASQPFVASKVVGSGKEAVGQSQMSSCGESLESPSHWIDWHKFKEKTPDSQKIQYSKVEGAKSVSPVLGMQHSDSSPTSSNGGDGPRLVRCTSSPMILNGRSPLGPLANAVPKRRESRSFFSLARKAVSRLTSSPNSGKAGQENENGDKPPAAATQKGRRLSKAGQAAQRCAENAGQHSSDKLPEDAGQEGGENPGNAVLPDIRKLSPFTEEWIAALEAAGQEALEMKSGSVQNSPPNKTSSSKSNPWSPVRRTAGLGPFDCTKRCS